MYKVRIVPKSPLTNNAAGKLYYQEEEIIQTEEKQDKTGQHKQSKIMHNVIIYIIY